jgi:probable addiction module antidote protein
MKTTRFDASEFLDDEETIAEYLAAALADGNPDVFIVALGDVAKARGMSEIAAAAGLGRESLYKSLRPGSKSRFDTIHKVVSSLGLKMTIETISDLPGKPG